MSSLITMCYACYFLAVDINEFAVFQKLRDAGEAGPTVTAKIRFPNCSNLLSEDMAICRGVSNFNEFELGKLRGKTSYGFDSTDLGNWIVFHIVSKYRGHVTVSTDSEFFTTITFEFPHAGADAGCATCKTEESTTSVDLSEEKDDENEPTQKWLYRALGESNENESTHHFCGEGEGIKPVHVVSTASPRLKEEDMVKRARPFPTSLPPLAAGAATADGAASEQVDPSPPAEKEPPHGVEPSPSAPASVSVSGGKEKPAPRPYLRLQILVVDDVPSNRKILSRLLTKQGHSCFLACDGAEVLKMIEEEKLKVDAICMDYEVIRKTIYLMNCMITCCVITRRCCCVQTGVLTVFSCLALAIDARHGRPDGRQQAEGAGPRAAHHRGDGERAARRHRVLRQAGREHRDRKAGQCRPVGCLSAAACE
jgi:hypothetical protein